MALNHILQKKENSMKNQCPSINPKNKEKQIKLKEKKYRQIQK